jgi:hypothetical protein
MKIISTDIFKVIQEILWETITAMITSQMSIIIIASLRSKLSIYEVLRAGSKRSYYSLFLVLILNGR